MGNLVSELNVKQDSEGSRAPLVLGPGEGLSTLLVTLFIIAGIWLKRGKMTKAELVFFFGVKGAAYSLPYFMFAPWSGNTRRSSV